jgi:hypothetical protein
MSKAILFTPSEYKINNEPDKYTLWQVHYKLHDSIKFVNNETNTIPTDILKLIDVELAESLPLDKWEEEFGKLDLDIYLDFPFAKEYVFRDQENILFSATLYAMDLNRYDNEVEMAYKIAEKILTEMNYSSKGKAHPEKFYKKLVTTIDLSDKQFTEKVEYSVALMLLEELCHRCLQFEKDIEWKLISEE